MDENIPGVRLSAFLEIRHTAVERCPVRMLLAHRVENFLCNDGRLVRAAVHHAKNFAAETLFAQAFKQRLLEERLQRRTDGFLFIPGQHGDGDLHRGGRFGYSFVSELAHERPR